MRAARSGHSAHDLRRDLRLGNPARQHLRGAVPSGEKPSLRHEAAGKLRETLVLRVRVIPCLLLREGGLVKTVRYRRPAYVGDPINTVRIFNELEVDELAFLDITASLEQRAPDLRILQEIADECFMPLSYGGGIRDVATAEQILQIGFEKLILNSAPFANPQLITELARRFGSQAVIVAIDVTRGLLGSYQVVSHSATSS